MQNDMFTKECDDGVRQQIDKYDYVPGINRPYDSGILSSSTAILNRGANSTYVNHRRYLTNLSVPSWPSVTVADGTKHPIFASGTLLGHPTVKADLVPSFTN
jgi:hypothetical protein